MQTKKTVEGGRPMERGSVARGRQEEAGWVASRRPFGVRGNLANLPQVKVQSCRLRNLMSLTMRVPIFFQAMSH